MSAPSLSAPVHDEDVSLPTGASNISFVRRPDALRLTVY